MIRPLTCICMLLAGGSGLYLYQAKHRAQMLDREIERTLRATDAARDRIGVLRGEWALLNEPERLAGLSRSHLGLKTLMPGQFVTAGELGSRLPPVVVPGAVHVPGEDETSVAAGPIPPSLSSLPSLPPLSTSAPAIPVRPVAGTAKTPPVPPATPSRMPAQVASASPLLPPRPVPAPPVLAPVVSVSASPIVAAQPVKPVPPRPAASPSASAVQVAASARPPAPAGTAIGESVMRTARLLSGVQQGAAHTANAVGPAPQPAANPPAYSPPSTSQAITSVLGGSRPLLPPPVPFGSAMAASVASTR